MPNVIFEEPSYNWDKIESRRVDAEWRGWASELLIPNNAHDTPYNPDECHHILKDRYEGFWMAWEIATRMALDMFEKGLDRERIRIHLEAMRREALDAQGFLAPPAAS